MKFRNVDIVFNLMAKRTESQLISSLDVGLLNTFYFLPNRVVFSVVTHDVSRTFARLVSSQIPGTSYLLLNHQKHCVNSLCGNHCSVGVCVRAAKGLDGDCISLLRRWFLDLFVRCKSTSVYKAFHCNLFTIVLSQQLITAYVGNHSYQKNVFQHQNPFRIFQSVILTVISVSATSFINSLASVNNRIRVSCSCLEMQWKCAFWGV